MRSTMAANDNVADLMAKAYDITRLIPYGKVTTYGGFPAHYAPPERARVDNGLK